MDFEYYKKYKLLIDYESYGLNPPKKFKPILKTINENYKLSVNFNEYGVKKIDKVEITDYILGEGTSSFIYKGTYNKKNVGIKTDRKEHTSELQVTRCRPPRMPPPA